MIKKSIETLPGGDELNLDLIHIVCKCKNDVLINERMKVASSGHPIMIMPGQEMTLRCSNCGRTYHVQVEKDNQIHVSEKTGA